MPEAVIVATARSPIGRAFKGSLRDLRPDDLAATIVQAALAKVPELDRTPIEDLYLGCGLPGGEQGFNMARVVAVSLGLDGLPGATVTRYCSSSLQTTRMAFHAIKAGEGDMFVSAGVETVSRFARAAPTLARHPRTRCSATPRPRTDELTEGGQDVARPARGRRVPDVYIAMGQTAENVAQIKDVSREEMDEFGVRSQNLAEKAIANGFWDREITPVTLPDGTVVSTDDGPRAGVTFEAVSGLKPVFRPDGGVTAGNCCPLNDGAAAVIIMSDTKARELGHHPAGPDRLHRRHRPVARDHGPRPGRGVEAGAGQRRHEHRRHRPGRDQRGVRRAGRPVVPGPRHRPRTSSTSTAARSPSATRSA